MAKEEKKPDVKRVDHDVRVITAVPRPKYEEKEVKAKLLPMVGLWAFIIALLLAVVGGIAFPAQGVVILILVILGIIVGLLNITEKEVLPFLVAAIALIVVGTTGFEPLNKLISPLGSWLDQVTKYFATFMAPAAVINAIRMMMAVARPG